MPSECVKVMVRSRPMNESEKKRNCEFCINCDEQQN